MMNSSFLSYIFIILQCFVVYSICQQCNTSIVIDHSKILLVRNDEVLLPTDKLGNIIINKDENITMACPSSYVEPVEPHTESVSAICGSSKVYVVNGEPYQAKDLICAQTPSPTEKEVGNCLGQNKLVRIGFKVGDKFIRHIELCFNDNTKETYYTYTKLSKKLCCCQIGDRVNFRTGRYFTGALANKYNATQQVATLTDILGGGRQLPGYIDTNNLFQIGHLVAKCDYVYEVQQKLTFYYINAAPQWRTFNNGNWRMVEAKIRNLVPSTDSDFHVYTGTFGVLDLENTGQKRSNVYLNWNPQAGIMQIPAPKYFWKVVIQISNSNGLAIIGTNNVYEDLPDLCTNIIDQASWLKGGKWNTIGRGKTIACSLDDFIIIPGISNQLPPFPHVSGPLLDYWQQTKEIGNYVQKNMA